MAPPELILKTSWKAVLVAQERSLLSILKPLAGLGLAVGLMLFAYFVIFKRMEWDESAFFSLFPLGFFLILFIITVLFYLLLDIIIIPICLFRKKEYSFKWDEDRCIFKKNGKVMIDVPIDDITFRFVNTPISGLGGNELGTEMIMTYMIDNQKRTKQISLRSIPDDEIAGLHLFVLYKTVRTQH